jgi:hypothetical protein
MTRTMASSQSRHGGAQPRDGEISSCQSEPDGVRTVAETGLTKGDGVSATVTREPSGWGAYRT